MNNLTPHDFDNIFDIPEEVYQQGITFHVCYKCGFILKDEQKPCPACGSYLQYVVKTKGQADEIIRHLQNK